MAELNRPLLEETTATTPATGAAAAAGLPPWPTAVAARTRFLVPRTYQKYWKTSVEYCTLRLDPVTPGLVQVVAVTESSSNNDSNNDDNEEEEMILDVWEVEDMIGADLHITPITSNDNTGTLPMAARNNNHHTRMTTSNAPISNRLVDRQGQAVLNVYVYPRPKPESCLSSLLLWCGSGNAALPDNDPPPNPSTYRRPTTTTTTEDLEQIQNYPRRPHHRSFVLAPVEDLGDVIILSQALRRLAHGRVVVTDTDDDVADPQQQPRRVLIICSPVSGPRKDGPVVLERIVRPILEQAGMTAIDTLITTHAGHARERMAVRPSHHSTNNTTSATTEEELDITLYTGGLFVMGGDGILSEVVNGLYDRPDAETVLPNLKIGVIPVGTSNGVAASLAYHCTEVDDLTTSLFMM
jgi:sphingosine kinase